MQFEEITILTKRGIKGEDTGKWNKCSWVERILEINKENR